MQNFSQLLDIASEVNFASIPVSNTEDGGKKSKSNADSVELSPAQKVKVFMQISKSDATRKK